MREYLEIGSAPADEPCAQVGDPDYGIKATDECRRFIELIRATLGPEPHGARLTIKSFPHDFGSYLEVVCKFDPTIESAVAYAFRCEAEAPTRWAK